MLDVLLSYAKVEKDLIKNLMLIQHEQVLKILSILLPKCLWKKYAREKNNIDFLIDFDSDNHFI